MAMRIRTNRFMQCMGQSITLQQTLYRYAHGMMVHAMQIAVCNRYHPLEARLARSLLSMRDRLQSGRAPCARADRSPCKLGRLPRPLTQCKVAPTNSTDSLTIAATSCRNTF